MPLAVAGRAGEAEETDLDRVVVPAVEFKIGCAPL